MQAAAFEQVPIFNELRSFMMTRDQLDYAHIQSEVEKFYEYAMFSHTRWQPPEPSFQMAENTIIYEPVPTSPTIDKLVNFCKLVQSRGFRWAWSDTCCINQSDKGVQPESVVSMFQWYCRAALTIVHLFGVFSESQEPLYERLHSLPSLSILTGRLHLPGFVFSLTSLTAITAVPGSNSIIHAYHATTPILGDVRIETNDDLVGMHGLVLIHPWIGPLLDMDFFGGAHQFDLAMRALRLIVRLKEPFGALLLASQERLLYKRIATDSFIKVQIREETALEELMDSERTVDVQ